MKVGKEWKVLGEEGHLKLTPDDEDSEVVAKMMMNMSPEQIEEMKQEAHIPTRTLQLYEQLKAKAAK
jgi:hypothetical protein